MEKLKKRLLEKGWSKKDVDKTLKIVKQAKKEKHPSLLFMDKALYWVALVIAVLGNIIISIALIPSLIALKSFLLFLVVIVLGLSFGFLFELLIRSIEHLEAKHHLFLGILIPIIALINFITITSVSNNLEKIFKINNPHNPYIIGIVYATAFILPFAFYKLILKKDYYSS